MLPLELYQIMCRFACPLFFGNMFTCMSWDIVLEWAKTMFIPEIQPQHTPHKGVVLLHDGDNRFDHHVLSLAVFFATHGDAACCAPLASTRVRVWIA